MHSRQYQKHYVLLDVPLVCQLPELGYGCELTSLTMLLQYHGIKIDKLKVAENAPRDSTPLFTNPENHAICVWGNPAIGYVGDITAKGLGYTIDPAPVVDYLKQTYNIKARDLTGIRAQDLKICLRLGYPVMVWTTYDFTVNAKPKRWQDSHGNWINADFNMHCVVLTGYDNYNFYYNDPLRNKKNAVVNQDIFTCGWVIHGRKALVLAQKTMRNGSKIKM
jgi:uncharacterized protein YvpB